MPAGAISTERDPALDFTRGALVVLMIIYHAVNYAAADQAVLRHLRFLPGAFVFLSGFVVSRVYLARRGTGKGSAGARVMLRGVRLFGLFLALNLLVHAVVPESYNRRLDFAEFIGRLDVVLGPGGVRTAVFGVLLPIAYVLAASGAALALGRQGEQLLRLLGVTVFAVSAAWAVFTPLPFNLELSALGFLGVLAGMMPSARIPTLMRRPTLIFLGLGALHLVLATGEPGFLFTAALVSVTLMALQMTGRFLCPSLFAAAALAGLGRHSLLAYLLQIAALQAIFRATRALGGGHPELFTAMIMTLLLTTAGIAATLELRARMPRFDRAYRAVLA